MGVHCCRGGAAEGGTGTTGLREGIAEGGSKRDDVEKMFEFEVESYGGGLIAATLVAALAGGEASK